LRQIKASEPGACHGEERIIWETASNVQVWLEESAPPDRCDSYEAVTWPACGPVHLVNKTTGKTTGDKEK
jgi:hypothetical protein